MKSSDIQSQLKDYKIREGYLLKRSRVLREWRKRWMVLTFNYLFSFENETCAKLTETIDLREVLALKSGLKNSQEAYPNYLQVQTKSTDFVFSACDAEQKWSWMVTLERLFDFKEKGASIYNNIDMIKSQGFQSQSQYQYKQKIKVRARSARTISLEEEERRKERRADELLNSLRIKQQEIQKKEQLLISQEKYLQKQKKSSSDFSVQIGQLNSQLGRLQQQNAFLREQVRSMSFRQEETNSQQDWAQTRIKSIEYLIRWFNGGSNQPELILITQFLLRLNQIQKYGGILDQTTHNCKHLSDFMKPFFTMIQSIPTNGYVEIYRVLAFMIMLFKDQYLLEVNYFVEAQRITVEWSADYGPDTPHSVLQASITLLQILFVKSNELKQKTLEAVTYLSSLNEEEVYRAKCQQILLKFGEAASNDQLYI